MFKYKQLASSRPALALRASADRNDESVDISNTRTLIQSSG